MAYAEALTKGQDFDFDSEKAETRHRQKVDIFQKLLQSVKTGLKATFESSAPSTGEKDTRGEVCIDQPVYDAWERKIMIDRKASLADRYPEAVEKLELIRWLDDNWDGYGSRSIPSKSIEWGYSVLYELVQIADLVGYELPEPEIFAGPGGVVQFEWTWNGKEFELKYTVPNNVPIFRYLWCPDDDPDSWEEGEFQGSLSENSALKRFLSHI